MKKVLPKSVLVAIVIGLLFAATLSAQNRVLTQNETLFIDKAVGRAVVFLAGTSVAMGRDGDVVSGTLAADTTLSVDTPIGRSTVFKGGTTVSFRPGGDVQIGTLAANTTLLIPVKALGKAALFRKGTSVVFQGDGCVISGTLAVSTTLLTNNSLGISRTFPAGAFVTFQPDGTATGTGGDVPGAVVVPGSPAPGRIEEPGVTEERQRFPVDETAWIVNNTGIPWVFHADRVVDCRGQWKGTWQPANDGVIVTIVHMGASDSFIVKFSADGRTFTAFKDGSPYRTGVRQ